MYFGSYMQTFPQKNFIIPNLIFQKQVAIFSPKKAKYIEKLDHVFF